MLYIKKDNYIYRFINVNNAFDLNEKKLVYKQSGYEYYTLFILPCNSHSSNVNKEDVELYVITRYIIGNKFREAL